jgi:hypothetical protein
MKPEVLLEHLEQAADRLGIRVSYEQLQSSVVTGGLCKVKGAYRIIIDKRATSEERLTTLASALAAFPPGSPGSWLANEEIAVPAKVRELLRLHEPSSKHRRTAA